MGLLRHPENRINIIMSSAKNLFYQLFDLLSRLPENVDPKKYRFFVLINFTCLAGMLVHGGYFIPLFFSLGAEELAYFNIGSALWFAVCLVLNRKGWIQF